MKTTVQTSRGPVRFHSVGSPIAGIEAPARNETAAQPAHTPIIAGWRKCGGVSFSRERVFSPTITAYVTKHSSCYKTAFRAWITEGKESREYVGRGALQAAKKGAEELARAALALSQSAQ